jgi:hypothetical protein
MKTAFSRIASLLLICCMYVPFAEANTGDAMERFKTYLNETVQQVKSTSDATMKRDLLRRSLENMETAAQQLKDTRGVDDESRAGLGAFKDVITDKIDQLEGRNGYEPVADADLDDFADYVQQDLEQAQRLVISIGVGTLLLLILLILLLT